MYTRIFADAGISVIAAIPNDELTSLSLVGFTSEVIVSDEATADAIGMITKAILLSPQLASVSKLIAVGVGQMISIDFKKLVMNDAGIEDLIAQARLRPVGSIQPPDTS